MIPGLIPARGGSKGLLRKNVRMIAGKPLIAWTIEAARDAKCLDYTVVSTEDCEIAEIAGTWGAKVLSRPAELATDNATSLSVWQHALSVHPAEILVNLYPTSPIRDDGLINAVVAEFKEKRPTCLATGFKCHFMPFGSNDDGFSEKTRRQDLEGFFYDDGNIYVVDSYLTTVQIFDQEGRFLLAFGEPGERPGAFHVPTGLTVDGTNRIFVCDSYNRRVQVFQYVGASDEDISADR